MKIVITGGSGFIGTNMSIEAINRGYDVVAFDNLWRENIHHNVDYMEKNYKDKYQFVWGDVRNSEDLDAIPKVDAVIHLAANPGTLRSIQRPIYDFRSNAVGTFNALEFAKSRHLPFIYASTCKTISDIMNYIPRKETGDRYVFTGTFPEIKDGMDMDENGIPVAINDRFPVDGFCKYGHSPYGISKLTGELYVQEAHVTSGLSVVIFRMSCIYGLFQKGATEQGWVDWFLRQIATGDRKITISGTGKQVRDVLDGRDVSRAYLDALEHLDKANGQIFTIGGGLEHNCSLLEMIKKMEGMTGKKAIVTYEDKRPSDQDWFISSTKKVTEILGWKPKISIEQALKDMLEHYD